MTTNTISQSDVVTAVTVFVESNKRPCPSKHLTEKFGSDVVGVLADLKESGVLIGLRGRNGGFALPDSSIVAKRAEHAAKKASKAVPTNEVAEATTSAA